MFENNGTLDLAIKLLLAIAAIGGIGGGSAVIFLFFRKYYFAEVGLKQSTADKNRADAAKTQAEAEKAKTESIIIKDERSQKQTILSIDEVTTIVKNFGVQLTENARLQESMNDAILLSDRRRTEIDELKGVVEYQRDEMREARKEMKDATFELGKCSAECSARDEKVEDLERRLKRAELTLKEHNLMPDPNMTGELKMPI